MASGLKKPAPQIQKVRVLGEILPHLGSLQMTKPFKQKLGIVISHDNNNNKQICIAPKGCNFRGLWG